MSDKISLSVQKIYQTVTAISAKLVQWAKLAEFLSIFDESLKHNELITYSSNLGTCMPIKFS